MFHQILINARACVIIGAIVFSFPATVLANEDGAEKFDAYEAIALANRDNCWRCHHLHKKKEGPSYQEVAKKYRGKPEALEKLVKHITLGKDVIKLSDGHKELHKFDKKRPPEEIRNLILYILAQ